MIFQAPPFAFHVHDKLYCSMNNYRWKCRQCVKCHSIHNSLKSAILAEVHVETEARWPELRRREKQKMVHCCVPCCTSNPSRGDERLSFLARWLTSARTYRIGGRKLCPSVCLYVKRYLLLQFCTDYNQTWINMIWAVAAKTLLCQIFHKWRKIEVNCVYISRCVQLVSYFWNAGMHTK